MLHLYSSNSQDGVGLHLSYRRYEKFLTDRARLLLLLLQLPPLQEFTAAAAGFSWTGGFTVLCLLSGEGQMIAPPRTLRSNSIRDRIITIMHNCFDCYHDGMTVGTSCFQ